MLSTKPNAVNKTQCCEKAESMRLVSIGFKYLSFINYYLFRCSATLIDIGLQSIYLNMLLLFKRHKYQINIGN